MRYLFVRHGNTFEEGQPPVWIGGRTDLPLTETGRLQARAVGQWCLRSAVRPKALVTGPLQRTRETAAIIREYTSGKLIISEEMREIDYGDWEGLSSAEISSRYGSVALTAWEKEARWPMDAGWPQQEATVTHAILDLMDRLNQPGSDSYVVFCTSNGILKTMSKHFAFDDPPKSLGVRTGHMCIVHGEPGAWKAVGWNIAPDTGADSS
jgi:broad specificity phosphatase PhoE